MVDKQPDQIKFYRKFLSKVDALIRSVKWNQSAYLEAIGKYIKSSRDQFKRAVDEEDPTYIEKRNIEIEDNDTRVYQMVYVSLYCVTGELNDWEKILTTIGKQVITRPIFRYEKDIKSLIRSKENSKSEAYVELKLLEHNVVTSKSADRASINQMGHEMVGVKDSRIDTDVIQKFVHENHEYLYQHGTLVPK